MSACPECRDAKTKVMQSWVAKNGWTVRRRRCVYGCGNLWHTYEVPEDSLSIEDSEEMLQPLNKRIRRRR